MPRQEKITLGEMRSSGPTRLLIYCQDYRCAHSVTTTPANGRMMSGCRISNRSSPVRLAGAAAPMSGRCLWWKGPRQGIPHTDEVLRRLLPCVPG